MGWGGWPEKLAKFPFLSKSPSQSNQMWNILAKFAGIIKSHLATMVQTWVVDVLVIGWQFCFIFH